MILRAAYRAEKMAIMAIVFVLRLRLFGLLIVPFPNTIIFQCNVKFYTAL
jgi:hypothetical protein